jgi:large subunit ribosomal protein L15
MKYNELKLKADKKIHRVGRGIAAGQGKTAGRGTKGQGSRVGSTRKPGFEGGQNPLMKRLPKMRGFKSKKVAPEVIYTSQLSDVSGTVDNDSVFAAGLVSSPFVRVKLIVRGEVSKKHTIKLQGASKTAVAAVESAGGTFAAVERQARPTTKKTDEK